MTAEILEKRKEEHACKAPQIVKPIRLSEVHLHLCNVTEVISHRHDEAALLLSKEVRSLRPSFLRRFIPTGGFTATAVDFHAV